MADNTMPEPTKTRPGDQQLPNGGRECVQDALIALIEDRKQLGIERYGSPLMTHNGRDSVRDATEEALDLTVYLMQVAMEMRDLRAEVARLRAGEADDAGQPGTRRTPAQWIRRFNDATPEQRIAIATAVFYALDDAARCFNMNHEGQEEELAQLRTALANAELDRVREARHG